MERLEKEGEEGANGRRSRQFDEPIDGGNLGKVTGIRRTRRVSKVLNEERTMKLIAEDKELLKLCIQTIEILSEEGVLAANFQGLLTDEQLDSLYDTKESFAFELEK